MQSMQADSVFAISEFTVGYIERPFIALKDKLFPPSQATLDKRLGNYGKTYLFGIKNSMKIIKDTLAKGANPDVTIGTVDENWNDAGQKPLLEMAVQRGSIELTQVLVKAGAGVDQKLECVGREHEVEDALRILSRKGGGSIAFTGERGAGATQMFAGVAKAIKDGTDPHTGCPKKAASPGAPKQA